MRLEKRKVRVGYSVAGPSCIRMLRYTVISLSNVKDLMGLSAFPTLKSLCSHSSHAITRPSHPLQIHCAP